MTKLTVDIDELKRCRELIRKINSTSIEKIEWMYLGEVLEPNNRAMQDFKALDWNNSDLPHFMRWFE